MGIFFGRDRQHTETLCQRREGAPEPVSQTYNSSAAVAAGGMWMRRVNLLLMLAVRAAAWLAATTLCPQTSGAQTAGPQTSGTQTSSAQSGGTQTGGAMQRRTPESVERMRRAERRVTLDVQVMDVSGKPVGGLREQDVTLLDNGHEQTVTSFREIDGSGAAPPAEMVLLLDTMNASFQDVVIERQGIEAFLRQNGGRLALPVSIVFLADTGVKIGKASRDGNALADDLKTLKTPMRVLSQAQGGEGAQDRSQRSLRALQMLSTYEAARPGRKLLVWVGPGWPLLSRSTADVSAQERARYFDSIVDFTTSLRRAGVTLYSVAPLNLAQYSQDPILYEAYLKGVEVPAQADSPDLALQVLAVHSGGMVLSKSGDLAGEIARCAADGRGYYEITFDAAEDDGAGRYHSLQVNTGRAGAVARTSTSYYAGGPQSTGAGLAPTLPAAAVASSTSAPKIIKAEARLVIVDVTVQDKKGQPVVGLTSADFQLKEDNDAQKIVSVEEHRATGEAVTPAVMDAVAPTDGTIVASNKPAAGTIWNVVLVDLYNTEKEDRSRLQSELEKFLKQRPEHEPLALVTMLGHIKIESSFQEGARAAYQYLHKHGLGALDGSTPANMIGRPGQEVLMPSADLAGSAIVNQANVDVDRQAHRAQTTLDCFSELARWLMPYPGRKDVYWLSGGFPLEGKQFGVVGYGLGIGAETKGGHPAPMQEKTDKELETARVAIYPVDVRGVAATNADGVTNADSTYEPVGTATALDNDLSAARRQEMLEIAKATGGTAAFNNNISNALSDDFKQAGTYYTISYTPPDKEWKGAYHRIALSVDQTGARLVYREGYYARSVEGVPNATPEQFKETLRLGAPAETAVQFTSKIAKAGDMATVEYAVEPNTVEFEEDASGQFATDIDFAVFEYDAKGKVLEKGLVRLSGKLTPEQRAHVTAKTLSAKQTIALKAAAVTLVLGVRDRVSGRFGRVEVGLAGR